MGKIFTKFHENSWSCCRDIEILPNFGVILATFWGNFGIYKITEDTAVIQQLIRVEGKIFIKFHKNSWSRFQDIDI